MTHPLRHLLYESFVPVLLIVVALFLSLIYAEYTTVRNADAVTLIRIDRSPIKSAKEDIEPASDTPFLAAQESKDPRYQEAASFISAGRWHEAEAIYLAILAKTPDSRTFNDLGALYLKKGEPQKALEYFDKALATPPLYARSHFNRALTYSRLGNDDSAIADYKALIKQLPYHFDGHYNLGLLYLSKRDFANAVKVFEQAKGLAGGERKARASLGLGIAYRELGQKPLARLAFENAIRLRPDYIEPRLELAALEDNTPIGRQRALARYDEVFRLKPDYPPAYFSLARYHSLTGNIAGAEAAYLNALKFNPEYRKAHYNLGLLFLSQKRYSEAITQFEWIVKRDPRHAETHFNLARAAYGMKDYATSMVEYQKAIDLRGGDYPEAYLNQGLIFVAQKKYKDAESLYQKAIRLKQNYPEGWYNLGLVQLKQQQWEQALHSFETALQNDPQYEQAWFNLGIIASRDERDDAAIDAYRHALAIRPNYPQARLNLAVRYARQKRHTEAIAEYRQLLEQDNSYAIAWFNLGHTYLEVQSLNKAEDALRHCLELEPQNLKAMKALTTALSGQQKYGEAIDVMQQAVALDASDAQLRATLAKVLLKAGHAAEARNEFNKALRLDPTNKRIEQEYNSLFNNSK